MTLVLDDNRAVAFGNEPVRTTGGDVIGRVSSGGVGYYLDASIAVAWVPSVVASADRLTVEVFGRQLSSTVADQPLYDPAGARPRA